ncbi:MULTISPECIES: iron-sulfur cluster assembly accessory protein [Microvirga]|uniref:iron-sulfur cluster assembly accessory protein n=1 Tax=Microvirga TaxID=186650 RepID=UPI001B38D46D|nr:MULTISPECIES: iron-sulfur cluster assembly accessory protein [unclassified Microvirga]MBQ0820414.1 iron-sulfur cluster assembly accessory protein [Microvirga sp. HBU67558]
MITLTDNAVAAVRTALHRSAEPVEGLRIMVQAGGCAGFKYLMGLDSVVHEGDAIIERDGIKVFIDVRSQPLVAGMIVDFITELDSSGFVFDNPNAREKCGCGKSFG